MKHVEIEQARLIDIAKLKDKLWRHGVESQLDWMKGNLIDPDVHCMLYINGKFTAYATLNKLKVDYLHTDGLSEHVVERDAWGLGSVCTSPEAQGKGIGLRLVRLLTAHIVSTDCPGLLLCRERLVGFYGKVDGWKTLDFDDLSDGIVLMGLEMPAQKVVFINRSF